MCVAFESEEVKAMNDLIQKITKTQNKAKSLKWGTTFHSETEVLFAVGHKSYPREARYFIVTESLMVREVDGNTQTLVNKCSTEEEVLNEVYELLKKWFPAKGEVA